MPINRRKFVKSAILLPAVYLNLSHYSLVPEKLLTSVVNSNVFDPEIPGGLQKKAGPN